MAGRNVRRASWAQPSLSRDFALLTAAIFFVMLLVLAWVGWITYLSHSESVIKDLETESNRIEATLETEISGTGHLLTAVGRQLAAAGHPEDLHMIAQTLQAFAGGERQYALWNWSDAKHNIVVTSNKGVLDQPVSIAERDYIALSQQEPWHIMIGVPVEGKVSNKWVIPIAIGMSDSTGKYVGTLTAAVAIDAITQQINELIKRDGISFAIVSKTYVPLTVVADSDAFSMSDAEIQRLKESDPEKHPQGVISQAGLFSKDNIYSYYLVSPQYPYIIVVGYDNRASNRAIRSLLWPRVIQVLAVAGFLMSLLWIIRSRVIKPVIELSMVGGRMARGGEYRALRHSGPLEIEQLAEQLSLIAGYITERRLVEDELRSKIIHLHRHQQRIQMDARQRSVLLAGLLAEYKKALRSINSQAQSIKDQVHGPIEERKYRSAAADIHQMGTTLELMVRKLIALSRVDAAGVIMRDEPVRIAALLEGTRRFAVDALEGVSTFAWQLPADMPTDIMLTLDGLHAQQALGYALLYILSRQQEGASVEVRIMRITTKKDEEDLLIILGRGSAELLTPDAVRQAVDAAETESSPLPVDEGMMDELHITLARAMLALQQATLALIHGADVGEWVLVRFPARRIFVMRQREI